MSHSDETPQGAMTEKPNSVCKWCHLPIEFRSGYWRGLKRENFGRHCVEHDGRHEPEPMVEPAAPQPVAGFDPRPDLDWQLDAIRNNQEEICQNESPRNVNAQVADANLGQMKSACASVASRIAPSKGTPKLEEAMAKITEICDYWHHSNAQRDEQIAAILRPFITPACTPPHGKVEVSTKVYGNLLAIWHTAVMLFSGPPNELPDVEAMRRRMHELATPASTGEAVKSEFGPGIALAHEQGNCLPNCGYCGKETMEEITETIWRYLRSIASDKGDEGYFRLNGSFAEAQRLMNGSAWSPEKLKITLTFEQILKLVTLSTGEANGWVSVPQDLLMELRGVVVGEWTGTPLESDKAKYLHTLWTQIDAIRFPPAPTSVPQAEPPK